MPKYLLMGAYSVEGVKGLIRDGATKRRDAIERALKALGVKSEAFYYAFGDSDVVTIIDAPDNVTAAALALAVNAAGAIQVRTVVLLTPQELDEAIRRSASYRPPALTASTD